MNPNIIKIARLIEQSGGKVIVVGGYVRDKILNIPSKDIDLEVYHLNAPTLEKILNKLGNVEIMGRSFGVFKIKGLNVDISLPRKDNKIGTGHRAFKIQCDPDLSFKEASKRRDFTMNSMGFDPLTQEILDPHGGEQDIKNNILRVTDPLHFSEDPLRAMRAAQFIARFEMEADPTLLKLASSLNMNELSKERIRDELYKLLLKAQRPSLGFEFLKNTQLLRFFPELENMIGVPQDPKSHPEGDVWIHTMMVIDEAKKYCSQDDLDIVLMLAALCHDLGKKQATKKHDDGRITAHKHDIYGSKIAENFLLDLKIPKQVIKQVKYLVKYHLAPFLFIKNNASMKAYRKLARELEKVNLNINFLIKLAYADHFGRTTKEALQRKFVRGELFLKQAQKFSVIYKAPKDAVQGKDLIKYGLKPSKKFNQILNNCRNFQDKYGYDDTQKVLDHVLAISIKKQKNN